MFKFSSISSSATKTLLFKFKILVTINIFIKDSTWLCSTRSLLFAISLLHFFFKSKTFPYLFFETAGEKIDHC